MKKLMNFTLSDEDTMRYKDSAHLKEFYTSFGLDGLELMPMGSDSHTLVSNDMIEGVHLRCIADWMDLDTEFLLNHYREDLDFAQRCGAKYVVFHIAQVSDEESFTYQMKHSDAEVIDAICQFINELLDGQNYTFDFLMENLWWPGLTLLDVATTKRLLDGVHYEKRGIMLDTGHYLHTNHELKTEEEAISYLQEMVEAHKELLPFFKGIHLQQSLTGEYVKNIIAHPPILEHDPAKRFCQVFEHIFKLDLHQPFASPQICQLVKQVNPDYLTFEYITATLEQHEEYLRIGTALFQ